VIGRRELYDVSMKTIILAGGFGTRISEETDSKPKPMVLLDDKPILWHIMNSYASQGFNDFVIATGYKGEVIHEWVSKGINAEWKVQAVDTGLETQTAGRLRRCLSAIGPQRVMATYGDGLGNVNLQDLMKFHLNHKKIATVTAVRPPARFGVLETLNGLVTHFGEKNQVDAGWINGGFFVFEPDFVNELSLDQQILEAEVLPALTKRQELMAFHHEGFWQPMDTLRERNELARLAQMSNPPWSNI